MSTPSSFPSVYHPTISEYYPLVIRLEDYLKCLIDPQDWSAVFRCAEESSGEDTLQKELEDLLSGVLLSFGNPQAVTIKEAWPAGGQRRIGQQVQSQVDVSCVCSDDQELVLNPSIARQQCPDETVPPRYSTETDGETLRNRRLAERLRGEPISTSRIMRD